MSVKIIRKDRDGLFFQYADGSKKREGDIQLELVPFDGTTAKQERELTINMFAEKRWSRLYPDVYKDGVRYFRFNRPLSTVGVVRVYKVETTYEINGIKVYPAFIFANEMSEKGVNSFQLYKNLGFPRHIDRENGQFPLNINHIGKVTIYVDKEYRNQLKPLLGEVQPYHFVDATYTNRSVGEREVFSVDLEIFMSSLTKMKFVITEYDESEVDGYIEDHPIKNAEYELNMCDINSDVYTALKQYGIIELDV